VMFAVFSSNPRDKKLGVDPFKSATELVRRQASERCVWAMGVVIQPPFFDDDAGFIERDELVLVQALVAKAAVEAFDKGILRRLSRCDMMQPDTMFRCPS
jgi:hypothetical protein